MPEPKSATKVAGAEGDVVGSKGLDGEKSSTKYQRDDAVQGNTRANQGTDLSISEKSSKVSSSKGSGHDDTGADWEVITHHDAKKAENYVHSQRIVSQAEIDVNIGSHRWNRTFTRYSEPVWPDEETKKA